jgi:NADPH:quinone reductase-like Zn-dependent oxidoreductase
MRAVTISAFGNAEEVLEFVEVAEPAGPAPGEVLLRVEYAPFNVNDLYVIQGVFPVRPELPGFVGNEGVGTVLAIGDGVGNLRVGDRVLVPLYSFSWREIIVVKAEGLFALPEKADLQQLSMLGINPPTAALLLSEYVDLNPGDWIVQNAANSGVGRAVIAFAKDRGFKTINFVRRQELVDGLVEAGGDVVLADGADAVAQAKAAIGDGTVRLGIDGVAGEATSRLVETLGQDGMVVGYAVMSGKPISVGMPDLIFKRATIRGFFLNYPEHEHKIPAALQEAAALIESGAIHVPVSAVYPLDRIKEAAAHVERGGKILLKISS